MKFFREEADPISVRGSEARTFGLILAVYVAVGAFFTLIRLHHLTAIDFPIFYLAGRFAGTPHLYDFQYIVSYEKAHGVNPEVFPYPAAFAYAFAPLARLPISIAFAIYMAFLSLTGAVASFWLYLKFNLRLVFAVMLALGFGPFGANFSAAQNTLCVFAGSLLLYDELKKERVYTGALIMTLLLYKPTCSVFLLLWLIIQKRWKVLGLTTIGAALWYCASAAALGGNWAWPLSWIALLKQYAPLDATANAWLNVGISSLLLRLGCPTWLVVLTLVALLASALYMSRRMADDQRFFVLLAMIPVVSPHALLYDAVLHYRH